MSLHPSGNLLLAGFPDLVRMFHVTENELLLTHEEPVKGIVSMTDTRGEHESVLVNMQLTHLSFSPRGDLFVMVTGRIVQVYSLYSDQAGGHPGRLHVLRGHANAVLSASWSPDGHTLWTASEDGAVYEWAHIGSARLFGHILKRARDCMRLDMSYLALACILDE